MEAAQFSINMYSGATQLNIPQSIYVPKVPDVVRFAVKLKLHGSGAGSAPKVRYCVNSAEPMNFIMRSLVTIPVQPVKLPPLDGFLSGRYKW
jgi:hypothetical protein